MRCTVIMVVVPKALLTFLALLLLLLASCCKVAECGHLRPQDSESRETKSLDGFWTFRLSGHFSPERGFEEKWFQQPMAKTCQARGDCHELQTMPVPSRYR